MRQPLQFVLLTCAMALLNSFCAEAQSVNELSPKLQENRQALQNNSERLEQSHINGLRQFENKFSSFFDVVKLGNCDGYGVKWFEDIITQRLNFVGLELSYAKQSNQMNEEMLRLFASHPDNTSARESLELFIKTNHQATLDIAEDVKSIYRMRLGFADAALSGGCFEIADFEYREVMRSGGPEFTTRALVGIQDVRERRRH
jgi:hypothetical protein